MLIAVGSASDVGTRVLLGTARECKMCKSPRPAPADLQFEITVKRKDTKLNKVVQIKDGMKQTVTLGSGQQHTDAMASRSDGARRCNAGVRCSWHDWMGRDTKRIAAIVRWMALVFSRISSNHVVVCHSINYTVRCMSCRCQITYDTML